MYGAVCLQFTQFPCDDIENMYFILSSQPNRKLLRVRPWKMTRAVKLTMLLYAIA